MSHEPHVNETICPLTLAPVGQDLRLCQLCKGRKMARRLAELGLTPGVCLRVVQDAGGPLLVSVRNSRVALGRGVASKLQVQILADGEGDESTTAFAPAITETPENGPTESATGWWRGRRRHGKDGQGRRQRWAQG